MAWAWLYLFAVFTAYYVIRPIRDEAGVAGGVENLPWLFTGTLLAMMLVNPPFAALVARLPRSRFIGITYRFFMLTCWSSWCCSAPPPATANVWVGRVFFIWTSVFNLFVVSVFWAFMVDLFTTEQGKRLFGFIAAAATVGRHPRRQRDGQHGAVAGRPVAAAGRGAAARAWRVRVATAGRPDAGVRRRRRRRERAAATNAGDRAPSAAACWPASPTRCSRRTCSTSPCTCCCTRSSRRSSISSRPPSSIATFADRAARHGVLRPGRSAGQRPDPRRAGLPHRPGHEAPRRRADADLRAGVTAVGFLLLGMMPTVAIVVGFMVLRRAGNFAFARPTREVLFTVVSREDKYKAKNFIDTVVYRFGDQVGAWSSSLVAMAGLGAGRDRLGGRAAGARLGRQRLVAGPAAGGIVGWPDAVRRPRPAFRMTARDVLTRRMPR